MRLQVGQLRKIIREFFRLVDQGDGVWEVTSRSLWTVGFSTLRGPYRKTGVLGSELGISTIALVLVRDRFKPEHVASGDAPSGFKPFDVIDTLKTGGPKRDPRTGQSLVLAPGLREKVTDQLSTRGARHFSRQDVDLIVTMPSRSDLVRMFGDSLAEKLGVRVIHGGIKKGTPMLKLHPDMSPSTVKTLTQSFERNIKTGYSAKGMPAQFRHLVDMSLEIDDWDSPEGLAALVTAPEPLARPLRVLLVDDLVTSGVTIDQAAAHLLGEHPEIFEVVSGLTMFKMQSGRR